MRNLSEIPSIQPGTLVIWDIGNAFVFCFRISIDVSSDTSTSRVIDSLLSGYLSAYPSLPGITASSKVHSHFNIMQDHEQSNQTWNHSPSIPESGYAAPKQENQSAITLLRGTR